MQTRQILILGSTGNLGKQALEVLDKYPEKFKIFGLVANKNSTLLHQQSQKYQAAHSLLFSKNSEEITALIQSPAVDLVLNFIPGLAGLPPTIDALKAGKTLLTANKEGLIAEGEKIMTLAKPDQLVPLDSEHNAIYEILRYAEKNLPPHKISKITLPCSGGPLLGRKTLEGVTLEQILNHPRWKMGPKVTVESALLINKGFEVIEAHYLFDLPLDRIQVKIHPQCQLHGAVEFDFGDYTETYAYTSPPDMREHIENGLLRAIGECQSEEKISKIDPSELQKMPDPDHETFPGIKLVKQAFQNGEIRKFLAREEDLISSLLTRAKPVNQFLTELQSLQGNQL